MSNILTCGLNQIARGQGARFSTLSRCTCCSLPTGDTQLWYLVARKARIPGSMPLLEALPSLSEERLLKLMESMHNLSKETPSLLEIRI